MCVCVYVGGGGGGSEFTIIISNDNTAVSARLHWSKCYLDAGRVQGSNTFSTSVLCTLNSERYTCICR